MDHQQYLADQRGQSSGKHDLVVIILCGILACLVPLWAIGQIYYPSERRVVLVEAAEDDCQYAFGHLPLSAVERASSATVNCIYEVP